MTKNKEIYGKSPMLDFVEKKVQLDKFYKGLEKSQRLSLWIKFKLLFVKKQSSADLSISCDWGSDDKSGIIIFKELDGVYYILECGDIK